MSRSCVMTSRRVQTLVNNFIIKNGFIVKTASLKEYGDE